MKRIHSIILTAVILMLAACGKKSAETDKSNNLREPEEYIAVKAMPLQKELFSQSVTASGQFTTDDETFLSFKTGGIVSSVLVKEGDYVRRGQLLATLDLTEIKAQVSQAQFALEKAQRDYTRANNLYQDSVVTLEMLENARTGLDLAKEQLATAKFNMNYSEIRAIADGYVLRKFVNSGQVVGPGSPILQTNGAGKGNWVLKVGVSDREWSAIQINDRASVVIDALGDKPFDAYVSHKNEGADPFTGSFTLDIRLSGGNPSGLAAGLFGKATIIPRAKSSTWSIPYDALLEGNGNKGYVFICNDNKTAKKVEVIVGNIGKDHIQVLSGLEDAQLLIVSGSAYLSDGSSITIAK